MNEDQQNFDSLRRLLALKRHEVPPPGYYKNFSRQVMARIRAAETQETAGLPVAVSWLLKWLQSFETKPMFAGGFATVICLLLLFGAVMAQRPEPAARTFLQPTPREATSLPMVATATPMAQAVLGQPTSQIVIDNNSTNPVINFVAGPPVGQTPDAQFLTFPMSGN